MMPCFDLLNRMHLFFHNILTSYFLANIFLAVADILINNLMHLMILIFLDIAKVFNSFAWHLPLFVSQFKPIRSVAGVIAEDVVEVAFKFLSISGFNS